MNVLGLWGCFWDYVQEAKVGGQAGDLEPLEVPPTEHSALSQKSSYELYTQPCPQSALTDLLSCPGKSLTQGQTSLSPQAQVEWSQERKVPRPHLQSAELGPHLLLSGEGTGTHPEGLWRE